MSWAWWWGISSSPQRKNHTQSLAVIAPFYLQLLEHLNHACWPLRKLDIRQVSFRLKEVKVEHVFNVHLELGYILKKSDCTQHFPGVRIQLIRLCRDSCNHLIYQKTQGELNPMSKERVCKWRHFPISNSQYLHLLAITSPNDHVFGIIWQQLL